MYKNGLGINKSCRQEKFWWRKSCSLGNKKSCIELKNTNATKGLLLEVTKEVIRKKVNLF